MIQTVGMRIYAVGQTEVIHDIYTMVYTTRVARTTASFFSGDTRMMTEYCIHTVPEK